jgi:hypothetical protein
MNRASSTRETEDTTSVVYELALEVLHPAQEIFEIWSSARDTIADRSDKDTYLTPLFVSARWGF